MALLSHPYDATKVGLKNAEDSSKKDEQTKANNSKTGLPLPNANRLLPSKRVAEADIGAIRPHGSRPLSAAHQNMQNRLQKMMKDLEEEEAKTAVVRLGDASIAAP